MSGIAGLEELGGGSAVSFVVIGPDAWISTGDGDYIKTPGGAAMFGSLEQSLAPQALLGSVPPRARSRTCPLSARRRRTASPRPTTT